ncbi:acyl carrier protein [soil metagenome]
MTQEKIFEEVKATLIEALNADDDAVTPAARLQADLGAESIDFLDIVFRLERAFSIKIPRGELFPESIFQGDPSLVKDGNVTPKGLAELRAAMPFADPAELDKFEKAPVLDNMGDLFTVNLIVRYIESKLAKK